MGFVRRSQRHLRARSHRPQHCPEKGRWRLDRTGWGSDRQRYSRTCEIHLGANRQELVLFLFSVAIVVTLIFDFDPTIAPSRRVLSLLASIASIRRGGVVGGRSVGIRYCLVSRALTGRDHQLHRYHSCIADLLRLICCHFLSVVIALMCSCVSDMAAAISAQV